MNPDGKTKIVAGQRFGKMIASRQLTPIVWLMDCDCGGHRTVKEFNLWNGRVKSCGCEGKTHDGDLKENGGNSSHPLYKTWTCMMYRCYRLEDPRYKDYGGRGITVDERWHDFKNFVEDMGERPVGTTLDRKNNNTGYSKENCRWLERGLQQSNMRSNKLIKVGDKTLTLSQWAKSIGITVTTLATRLRRGWSIERAFNQPIWGPSVPRVNSPSFVESWDKK